MYKEVVEFIKSLYPEQVPVPLHAPVFLGKEKEYLTECIDSTFVSYVGKYVTLFEKITAEYTRAQYAVVTVNGTVALQLSLQIAGVEYGSEVLTQPLTFVATPNAISHCGAIPVFVDVDLDTMGMSPDNLSNWLTRNTKYDPVTKRNINRLTYRPVTCIVPMHTFGFPCRIDEIVNIADKYNIPVIEDAAESIGSFYKGKHTGTFGLAGILSYNGNKTITTGGGGMVITDNEEFARKVKHFSTTAKLTHKYEFIHDEVGYNYRLTNLNAAVGVAQMEQIDNYIDNKRKTAKAYKEFFEKTEIKFVNECENTRANFWLNSIVFDQLEDRNCFLDSTNENNIMTRPIWRLMNKLPMYQDCQTDNLDNAKWLEERVVNIPSGFRNTK